MAPHTVRRLATTLAVAATAITVAVGGTQPTPTDAAGTRYVDLVFPSATVQSNVVYATAPALVTGTPTNLVLDVLQPTGDGELARPALFVIHGGGFKGGDKSSFTDTATQWARRGYVVLNINYRLDSGNKCQEIQDGKVPPSQLAAETARCTAAIQAAQWDAEAAIRWLRANASTYRVDPTRIAAMGGSAGAVTVAHMAYRWENAGDIGDHDGEDSRIGAGLAMSGCNYSPETVSAGDAPVSYIHAEFDAAVPFQCAIDSAALSRSKGVPAQTMLWYGESTHAHSLYKKYQSTIDPVWTKFLIDQLNLRHLVPAGTMTEIHGNPNSSAVVSLTAHLAVGPGYLQALPCDATPGSTSNLNTDGPDQTRAGLAVVQFDETGTACVYNSMNTHVIVDLQGYLAADAFDDLPDDRLLDTRSGSPATAGSLTVIHGEAGRSAVLSLVATRAAGRGWVQALPCDAEPGSTSNLNTDATGQTRAALAIVPFDANGEACVYSSAQTHLIVDLQGYFTSGAFVDLDDQRLVDSRDGSPRPAGGMTMFSGPANGSAFISITSVGATGRGWMQVLPCDGTPGSTSNLNTDKAGLTIAGAGVAHFDADGHACVYTSVTTHLIVDLQGVFSTEAFDDIADVRLLDTRPV